MGRDYSTKRKPAKSQVASGPAMPGWLWMLVGLTLGFVIAASAWIVLRPVAHGSAVAAVKAAVENVQPADKKVPPKKESRFSFYEMLPNYEVLIPNRDKAGNGAATADSPGDYVVQVGAFQDPGEAEKLRASIALLGIEARVERVTIDNRQTWYRVRIGPESDVSQVNEILGRLRENGIQPMLMRVKSDA